MAMRNLKNFPGMTVTKVDGCGHGLKKVTDDLRQELTDYTPKILIQMITPDNLVEGILQIIVETAVSTIICRMPSTKLSGVII